MNLESTLIQYHAKQSLLFSLKRIVITKIIRTFLETGTISFLLLNTSVSRTYIFLWWIETELSFLSSSSNEDDLSSYVILSARSCNKFIFFIKTSVIKHPDYGRYSNWDVTNAFKTVFLFLGAFLANTLSFDMLFHTEAEYVIFKREF